MHCPALSWWDPCVNLCRNKYKETRKVIVSLLFFTPSHLRVFRFVRCVYQRHFYCCTIAKHGNALTDVRQVYDGNLWHIGDWSTARLCRKCWRLATKQTVGLSISKIKMFTFEAIYQTSTKLFALLHFKWISENLKRELRSLIFFIYNENLSSPKNFLIVFSQFAASPFAWGLSIVECNIDRRQSL